MPKNVESPLLDLLLFKSQEWEKEPAEADAMPSGDGGGGGEEEEHLDTGRLYQPHPTLLSKQPKDQEFIQRLLTFFHGGICNEHLPQVFQESRPCEGGVSKGIFRHLWNIPKSQHLKFGMGDQSFHEVS